MHVGIASGFANHTNVPDRQFIREEMTQLLLAAELGFESIWMTEHHFSNYSISPNPLQYLTWLAAKTGPNVRLGTQVVVVPWRDPVRLAEEIAVLDHVSDGRAIIGFGRGLARMEYEGLRVDQNMARQLFDEIVPMVINAFETGYIEGGEIFKQARREIRPKPFKSLKGRVFCAAGSPASMVSAAKLGLGRLYLGQPMVGGGGPPKKDGEASGPARPFQPQDPTAHKDVPGQKLPPRTDGIEPANAQSAEDAWLEAWTEAHPGVPPVHPFASNLVFIDDSADKAMELCRVYAANTFRAAVKNYELTSSHHGGIKGYEAYKNITMTEEDVEKAAANVVANSIVGTPQRVLEQLDEVRKAREPQGMMPHVYTGGMPHEDCMSSIRVFAKHCLREMQSWPAAPWTVDGDLAVAAE
jgi:alkanesulfonate monooxygenase SsuD/methylene tetrahydromethanopterin reductase-like flavin-dependent oxidoreductase (luciferase family)